MSFANTLCELIRHSMVNYIQKSVGASSACSTFEVLGYLYKKQTEKHPRGSILIYRKVCREDTRSSAHYGEYMLHPVELPLHLSLIVNSEVPKFRMFKNKASVTPFNM